VVLLEPARADADMFRASIFSYADRERLCSRAYETTRATLLARFDELAPLLAPHGLALRDARLRDGSRQVADALNDPRPVRAAPRRRSVRRAARDLAHTLDHLERHLAALR
jgi:hypothetical protein